MMRYEWDELSAAFEEVVLPNIRDWVPPESPHFTATRQFALGRLEEGRQLGQFFRARERTGRVLDLGAGNGGVSIGIGNDDSYAVTTLDIVPNRDVRALQSRTQIPLRPVVGSGHELPFADNAFDIVLCLDTIEHVPRPELLGSEIMRVLRPGGVCMITTPPRLRYWFRRDPHYAIPALLALPDRLQRFVATAILRRTNTYDVVHIFWHVSEITRLFPGHVNVQVLWNRAWPFHYDFRDAIWFRCRNFLWDRIVIEKAAPQSG